MAEAQGEADERGRGGLAGPDFGDALAKFGRDGGEGVALQPFFRAGDEFGGVIRSRGEGEESGGGAKVVVGAFGGVATAEALDDELTDNRCVPEGAVLEETEDAVAVGDGFVFERPPEQERDVFVLGVVGTEEEFADDGKGVGAGESFAGAGELGADFGAGFYLGALEGGGLESVRDFLGIPEKAKGPEADEFVGMLDSLESESVVETAAGVDGPEGLQAGVISN